MGKLYLSAQEYEAAVEAYRDKYGYDDMSDDEKAEFDERLDQAVGVREESGDRTDSAEEKTDSEKLRDEMKEKYGYNDMSDDEKASFDEKLDEVFGAEDEGGDDSEDAPEKVLSRRR